MIDDTLRGDIGNLLKERGEFDLGMGDPSGVGPILSICLSAIELSLDVNFSFLGPVAVCSKSVFEGRVDRPNRFSTSSSFSSVMVLVS